MFYSAFTEQFRQPGNVLIFNGCAAPWSATWSVQHPQCSVRVLHVYGNVNSSTYNNNGDIVEDKLIVMFCWDINI